MRRQHFDLLTDKQNRMIDAGLCDVVHQVACDGRPRPFVFEGRQFTISVLTPHVAAQLQHRQAALDPPQEPR